MTDRQTLKIYFVGMLALFALYAYALFLGPGESDFLLKEGKLVETLSVLGYFICALFLLFKGGFSYASKHYDFIILTLFCACRELDFHKRFTTMGMFKIRLYTSPDVPVLEKLICAVVILFLAFIALRIVYMNFGVFLKGLKKRDSISIGALLVFVLLVMSKAVDGLSRKLKPLGIELGEFTDFAASAWEEVMEVGIPYFMILVAYMYFRQKKLSNKTP